MPNDPVLRAYAQLARDLADLVAKHGRRAVPSEELTKILEQFRQRLAEPGGRGWPWLPN